MAQPLPSRKPQGTDPKGLDESYDDYNARITQAEADRRNGKAALTPNTPLRHVQPLPASAA